MNYKSALNLAAMAHKGQVDKAGKPYLDHPIRVARRLTRRDDKVIALLHDVVEDSGYGFEDLAFWGATPAQITILGLLTHHPGVPYQDYIRRLAHNPQAVRIKLADLYDNTDPKRLTDEPAEVIERRRDKYAWAIQYLSNLA